MDYKYEKDQLEMYKKTLENSIKMYETTLEQMAEKGSSKETMSFVLQMKGDTENSLNDANLLLNKLENLRLASRVGPDKSPDESKSPAVSRRASCCCCGVDPD